MTLPFFPDPLFGWIFLGVLLGLLGVSCVTDLRRMIVPKWITLPALALGIIVNVLRGVALAEQGLKTWALEAGGPVLGGLDGFLFALAGFFTGFGLFFLMWILGACGGGDVKLCAALGAWVGPFLMLLVLAASIGMVFLLMLGRSILRFVRGEMDFSRMGPARRALPPMPGKTNHKPMVRALGLSLPLLLATAVVLLWHFRAELRVVNDSHEIPGKVQTHAN